MITKHFNYLYFLPLFTTLYKIKSCQWLKSVLCVAFECILVFTTLYHNVKINITNKNNETIINKGFRV